MSDPTTNAELTTLVGLFYRSLGQVGRFEEVPARSMPQPYGRLLDHRQHMTVTLEDFHGSLVDLQVLETQVAGNRYARRILLTRQSDGRVVLFGIARLNLDFLDAAARGEIESQTTPLGRVLIERNVLRQIDVVSLWRITPGPSLCPLLGVTPRQVTYGRTALIHCNGQPAVELLEIIAPQDL